ncbi:unnamed protein product [Parajaminaea phylloscopi]
MQTEGSYLPVPHVHKAVTELSAALVAAMASLRGPGLTALSRQTASSQAYSNLSTQLSSQQLTDLRSQLDTFASSLRTFASQHKKDILKDAEFRGEFQRMCASIGVDPLCSDAGQKVGGLKGMWNDLLGLGDYYYELGVQIVDVCVSTRDLNGGMMDMDELIWRVQKLRTGKQSSSTAVTTISHDDVIRAIKALKPLSCGYEVVALSGSLSTKGAKLVRSLPGALSLDSTIVLSIFASPAAARDPSSGYAYVTEDLLMLAQQSPDFSKPSWTRQRARNALQRLCDEEGTLWLDYHDGEVRYYTLAVGAPGT